MTTLTLVNPQPMETLPEDGFVFVHVTSIGRVDGHRYTRVTEDYVANIREASQYTKYHAWSYTATFKEGEV